MAQVNDKWSSEAYKSAASFVPKLATKVVSYLSIAPTDHILDIGCGDGQLTIDLAAACPQGSILGLDASPSLLATASQSYSAQNCTYIHHDCRAIASCPSVAPSSFDKAFSNAALHWILREPSTRQAVFNDVFACLKPGGVFVYEMGGKGNVGEVHAAVLAALVAHGVPIAVAREACPWFFPSEEWSRQALVKAGFEVERVELEYRPTLLTPRKADGSGGLEGWVRLMAAEFLAVVDEGVRNEVVRQVCDTLETIVTREEDGTQWIGYTRLRAVARKGVDAV